MGPYCTFCDHRCFVPRVVPGHPRITILATCRQGAAYDMKMLGYDYSTAINPALDGYSDQSC